jgi:hypothetical protein
MPVLNVNVFLMEVEIHAATDEVILAGVGAVCLTAAARVSSIKAGTRILE